MTKFAYVIGINEYKEWNHLRNAVNDCITMQSCLEKCGFEVKATTNATRNQLAQSIYEFKTYSSDMKVALLYFAGHGVEIEGKQFLIPMDGIRPKDGNKVDNNIMSSYVDITSLINDLPTENDFISIFILDCCRERLYRTDYNDYRGIKNEVSIKQGTFISFSTGPNLTASDGHNDKNGLFMSKLEQYINKKDIKIEELFKKVRLEVIKESKSQQIPWEHSSLIGDFYFIESDEKRYLSDSNKPEYMAKVEELLDKELTYNGLISEINSMYKELIEAKVDDSNVKKDILEFTEYTLKILDEKFLRRLKNEKK